MRVLLAVPMASPWTGGVETHVRELAKALVQQGHQVEVWSGTDTKSNLRPQQLETKDSAGVSHRYFPLPISGLWAFSPAAMVRAVVQSSKSFDVIHLHQLHRPLAIRVLFALRRSKSQTARLVTGHWHGTGHTALAKLAHPFYRPIANWALRAADALIAVSDSESKTLLESFPSTRGKIDVIPNGIVPIHSAPGYQVAQGNFTVLMVGRLERYKGVDRMIAALPVLPKQLTLVVAGPGDQTELHSLAERLGVAERVKLLGVVEELELHRWWATADAFISLSTEEAFGLTFGEALTVGLPIVATNLAAHQYVLGLADNPKSARVNFLSVEATSSQIAQAITQVMTTGLGKQRTPVSLPGWTEVASQTVATYLSAIKRRTGEGRASGSATEASDV